MRTISPEKLTSELGARPGLIPIDVHLGRNQVIWCDVEDHRFTEPVFADFLSGLSDNRGRYTLFACDLASLGALELPDNCLNPSGFVFHTGRCGSTLFSRALAQSPRHLVMSEAQPHNAIWWHLTDHWKRPHALSDNQLRLFAKLVRLTGRRRDDAQQSYFVKFSSWQTLLFDAIRKVFPGVPRVYLYRNPAEILASLHKARPAWLDHRSADFGAFCTGLEPEAARKLNDSDYSKHYLTHMMDAGVRADDGEMTYINYRELKADRFGRILGAAFGYEAGEETLVTMRAQFDIYSKDVSGTQSFEGDKHASPEPGDVVNTKGRLNELYQRLEDRAWTP